MEELPDQKLVEPTAAAKKVPHQEPGEKEVPDQEPVKPKPLVCEWDFRGKCAEMWADGELMKSTRLIQKTKELGKDSRILATFPNGMEAEVAGAWFWMIGLEAGAGPTTPVVRIGAKTTEGKNAKN